MNSVESLANIVAKGVIDYQTPSSPNELYEPIAYILTLGGKRIRPIAVLAAYEAISGANPAKAIPQALAIEVFHNFTLVHDDIMDKAPLRRNKPTVHKKWDENRGILSGDAMMILSYDLLINATEPTQLGAVLSSFNKTALEVCEGQQEDMNFELRTDVSLDEYLEMIRKKTAVLLGGSFKIGGQVAGATSENLQGLYDFGEQLGLAFQIKDDYLDTFGDPASFGKQTGGDILSEKKTFLYLKAMEVADESTKAKLTEAYEGKGLTDDEKINTVKQLFTSIGVTQMAETQIQAYSKAADEALQALSIPEEQKKTLKEIMNLLLKRTT